MPLFYAYDADGWLIGWHTDASRANSTPVAPIDIPLHEARWDGSKWVRDPSLVAFSRFPSYVQSLWTMTNNFIERQCDINSRITIAAVLADPFATEQQKLKAKEVQEWVNSIWSLYRQAKERARTTGEFVSAHQVVQSYPPCPYSVWEITS